jgi:integrase
MKGGIYSDERCPICGGTFKDNYRDRLQCPKHPDQWATRFRIKFGKLNRRFNSYQEAQQVLWLWRGEEAKGTFNPKEYMASSPIGFTRMVEKFLKLKENTTKYNSYRVYSSRLRHATDYFGDMPVTQVGYSELEDFIHSLELGSYTVQCILDLVMEFLAWCEKRGEIKEVPERPKWKSKQKMRKILDKDTQIKVMEKVYEVFWQSAPRACTGIELLITYSKLRPDELRQVTENDIDLRKGTLTIPPEADKQGEGKTIQLLDKHVELIRSLRRGFGKMYFLRHDTTGKGKKAGQQVGKSFLNDLWKKACSELGVEGVPLYPGTRHTTISDLARKFPLALVKQTTGHMSKALERYLVLGEEDCETLYKEASPNVVRLELKSPGK